MGAGDKYDKDKAQAGKADPVTAQVLPAKMEVALSTNTEQLAAERKQERQIKAVMLLDDEHQRKLIDEEKPKLEKAEHQRVKLLNRLQKLAEKEVRKLKVSQEFTELKQALKKLNMGSCSFAIGFKGFSVEDEEIRFEREIKHPDNYHGISGDDILPFTEEMLEVKAQYEELDAECKRAQAIIVEAEAARRDFANRMAKAEGLLALKQMGAEEQEEVQAIYGHMAGNLSAERLLGAGN